MTDRLALVTGGTTGIGASVCKELKESGYRVVANYYKNDESAKLFEQETGVKIYNWNVTSPEDCIKGVEKITDDFSSNIEILVNNAGIVKDNMMHKMSIDSWDRVITTDLSACFYMSRAVIGAMRKNHFGRIINISSVNAQMGQSGQTNYCAAKAGVIGFTKALAHESAKHCITVNTLAPGYTDTDMVKTVPEDILNSLIANVPMGRLGKPEEIAYAVAFLVADRASFITGETISVNGGYHME